MYVIPSGAGDHGCEVVFLFASLLKMLLTESKMDVLLCTDYVHGM